jgi:hypothetical protein
VEIRNRRPRDVVIADPEFPRIAVAAGGVADVPAELAKSLLKQPDRWEAVESKPKKVAPSGEKE